MLVMDNSDVVRVVFLERYRAIKTDRNPRDDSYADSIVSDLIKTTSLFNLNKEIDNMVERGHIYEKNMMRKIVWERALSPEYMYWKIEYKLH